MTDQAQTTPSDEPVTRYLIGNFEDFMHMGPGEPRRKFMRFWNSEFGWVCLPRAEEFIFYGKGQVPVPYAGMVIKLDHMDLWLDDKGVSA